MNTPIDKDRIAELWSVERVAVELHVSSGSIWNWVRKGTFPKPLRFGPRSLFWEPEAVGKHIATLREWT
jgi:predicted DNA-binding transcriptional regulator AlpA